jgi:hypothetical protein
MRRDRRDRNEAIGFAAVAILAILLGACTLEFPGDSTIVNTATNAVTQPSPVPSGSPSPGTTGCPGAAVVASIRVNPFGYDCPSGTPPNNSSGLLPVGCTAAVTATPKDIRGVDVPAELHGPDITWAILAGAQFIQVTDDPNERFNKNVLGVSAPGEFVLQASLCGKSGAWVGRTVAP